jgi:hypothetical protein
MPNNKRNNIMQAWEVARKAQGKFSTAWMKEGGIKRPWEYLRVLKILGFLGLDELNKHEKGFYVIDPKRELPKDAIWIQVDLSARYGHIIHKEVLVEPREKPRKPKASVSSIPTWEFLHGKTQLFGVTFTCVECGYSTHSRVDKSGKPVADSQTMIGWTDSGNGGYRCNICSRS